MSLSLVTASRIARRVPLPHIAPILLLYLCLAVM